MLQRIQESEPSGTKQKRIETVPRHAICETPYETIQENDIGNIGNETREYKIDNGNTQTVGSETRYPVDIGNVGNVAVSLGSWL
jgi:hypothetical protein